MMIANFIFTTTTLAMMPSFFRGYGLVIAAILLVLWWLKIRDFKALFQDRTKRRTTALFLLPALVLVGCGIYFWAFDDPYATEPIVTHYSGTTKLTPEQEAEKIPPIGELYMANNSNERGKIRIGKLSYEFPPLSEKRIAVRANLGPYDETVAMKAWLGKRVVIDTVIGKGKYIGTFSDDGVVVAEQILYAIEGSKSADAYGPHLTFQMLDKPGIMLFSEGHLPARVYGFGEEPPSSIRTDRGSLEINWQISTMSEREWRSRLEVDDQLEE